jgi:hypothetical protein
LVPPYIVASLPQYTTNGVSPANPQSAIRNPQFHRNST